MRFLIATWLLRLLPPTRAFALKRLLLRRLGIAVGARTAICGNVGFFGGGRVTIGADCWIGIGTTFYPAAGGDIAVGDGCDLAPECCLHTGSHAIGPPARRAGTGTAAPIQIGAGCWLGLRTTVLAGCTIGPGSVVAAGSLVTRDQPRDALILGSPAAMRRPLA